MSHISTSKAVWDQPLPARLDEKSSVSHQKSPILCQKSPILCQKSPILCQKSPILCQKSCKLCHLERAQYLIYIHISAYMYIFDVMMHVLKCAIKSVRQKRKCAAKEAYTLARETCIWCIYIHILVYSRRHDRFAQCCGQKCAAKEAYTLVKETGIWCKYIHKHVYSRRDDRSAQCCGQISAAKEPYTLVERTQYVIDIYICNTYMYYPISNRYICVIHIYVLHIVERTQYVIDIYIQPTWW